MLEQNDNTTLLDGIEIKFDNELIEIIGHRDVEEMTVKEIEVLIENNL